MFDVEFVDAAAIGGGMWESVPESVAEEISQRTPGFSGWQQERWFTHCGDGAEFLAIAGNPELDQYGARAVEAIREECGLEGAGWNTYRRSLNRDAGPTAYLFRCRHCGMYGGYSDCH
jgi:uncharacterized protein CbrC (UPF0167 family)